LKLSDLYIKLGLRKDGFDKGLDDAKKKTNVFGNAVKKIGGLLAGAFAVDRLIAFGRELVEIGGVAQGVEDAFARIGDAQTLRGLQQATRGTVSELELMKRAVSANNLGLPIQNLASLFEFATKRAQDTGESVDYLVNSIVTGIGRKSPLILDNLGISAIQLREKLNGVGMESASVADVAAAVGEIAAESMRQSGEIIETNAVKMQQLKTAWDDWKLSISQSDTVLNFVSESLKEVMALGTIFTSSSVSGWQKIKALLFDSREEFMAMAEQLEETKRIAEEMGPEPFEFISQGLDDIIPKWEENNELTEEAAKKLEKIGEAADDAWKGLMKMYLGIKENAPALEDIFDLTAPEINTGEIANFADKLFGDEVIDELPIDTEKIKAQIDEFNGVMSNLQSMTTQAIISISQAFGEALAGGGWDNFGNAVLQAIGSFLQQMGGLMIAYGIYMALFDSAIKAGPAGWPLAIAAGVGLVAAGAAISSLASGGVSGSGAYSGATASTGGSSASTALSGDVRFVLEGDKLVGAINGSRQRRSITG